MLKGGVPFAYHSSYRQSRYPSAEKKVETQGWWHNDETQSFTTQSEWWLSSLWWIQRLHSSMHAIFEVKTVWQAPFLCRSFVGTSWRLLWVCVSAAANSQPIKVESKVNRIFKSLLRLGGFSIQQLPLECLWIRTFPITTSYFVCEHHGDSCLEDHHTSRVLLLGWLCTWLRPASSDGTRCHKLYWSGGFWRLSKGLPHYALRWSRDHVTRSHFCGHL